MSKSVMNNEELAYTESDMHDLQVATIERCKKAVWDAGGDNVEFHCAAIEAAAEVGEPEMGDDLEKLRSRARTVAAKLSKRAEISPPDTRKHLRQLAHELSLAIMGREP